MNTARRTLDTLSAAQLRRMLERTEQIVGADSDTAARLRRLVAAAEAREARREGGRK